MQGWGCEPRAAASNLAVRLALGICYRGAAYHGWQSQVNGQTVQDFVERALLQFAGTAVRTVCAGRTDTGVHALNQVIHFDTELQRDTNAWIRGGNRYLPADIAFQWCQPVAADFHARNSARGRRYVYLLLEAPVRPTIEQSLAGWVFRPLDGAAMKAAAALLVGEHDFSAFRSSQCQAASPVKQLRHIQIERRGPYWRFDFEASAFLHHMVRNLMGCLIAVGSGAKPLKWLAQVLESRDRRLAAPTFSAAGLYFHGPYYDAVHAITQNTPAMHWLP